MHSYQNTRNSEYFIEKCSGNSDRSLTIIKSTCKAGTSPSDQRAKGSVGEMLYRSFESTKNADERRLNGFFTIKGG